MTFYATIDADSIRSYMPAVPYLLPASSWARYQLRPVRLPRRLKHLAADCGGFVATRIWGDYRFSPTQYVSWLHTFRPEWAAMMDYCCEDEITAGKPGLVRQRQERTTQMAWYFWQRYRFVPWVWVPSIQGWQIANLVTTWGTYSGHIADGYDRLGRQQNVRVWGSLAQPVVKVGYGALRNDEPRSDARDVGFRADTDLLGAARSRP
jgi:hypothetical protein